jgi:hypothetical protein
MAARSARLLAFMRRQLAREASSRLAVARSVDVGLTVAPGGRIKESRQVLLEVSRFDIYRTPREVRVRTGDEVDSRLPRGPQGRELPMKPGRRLRGAMWSAAHLKHLPPKPLGGSRPQAGRGRVASLQVAALKLHKVGFDLQYDGSTMDINVVAHAPPLCPAPSPRPPNRPNSLQKESRTPTRRVGDEGLAKRPI